MPKERIDWEQRGYADYPRHDLYPNRDKYGPRIEKRYLTGWHKRCRYEEIHGSRELDE